MKLKVKNKTKRKNRKKKKSQINIGGMAGGGGGNESLEKVGKFARRTTRLFLWSKRQINFRSKYSVNVRKRRKADI